MSKIQSILVTGGYGFVGSRLLAQLADRPNVKLLAVIRKHDPSMHLFGAQSIEQDLTHTTPTAWDGVLGGIDTVIHTAARAHQLHDDDPVEAERAFWKINVEGTMALARQASASGVRRFIFLSSIKVNGEATLPGQKFKASDPTLPQDAYGRSKAEAEIQLQALSRETGMEVVIIRPPLVYGPGVKANFKNMIHWIKRGIPLPLSGLQNQRSLIGLDNLISLIITCIDHPAAGNQIFLAADERDLSTAELIRAVAQAANCPDRLFPFPTQLLWLASRLLGKQAIVQRLCGDLRVDSQHTQDTLNWAPSVSMQDELVRTIKSLEISK